MFSNRGQAALEYMMIMGITLAILVPLFSLVTTYTNNSKVELRISSLDDSLNSVAESADMVYSQGYPAKITTRFHVPEGTVSTNVTDHHFTASISTGGGATDLFSKTSANLTGSLPSEKGNYRVSLKMTERGVVNVTY